MVDEDEFDDLEQTAIRQNPLPQSAQIFDDDDDEEFEKTAVRTNPMAGVDISSVIDGEAATGVYKGEQGGVPQQLIDSYMSNSYEDDDELDGQTKIAGPPSNAMTAGAAYALGEEEDDGATIVRTPGAVPGLPSYPDHLEDEEDVDTMVGRVEKGMELPRHLDSGPAAPVEGDATVVKSVGAAAQPVTDATIVAAMLPGAVAAAQAHDLEHDTMVSEVEPDTMVGTVESDTVVSQMPRSAGMLPGAISEDAPTSTNLEHDTVVKNAIPSLLPGALGPGQKTVDPDDTSAMAAFDASDYEEYYQEEYGDYSQSTPPGEQDYDDYDEYQATQVGELPYQLPSGIVDDEEEGIGSAVTPDTLVQSPQAKRQNPMANVAEGDDTMVHGAAASEFAHAATERMETGAPDPYGQSSPEDDPNDTAEEQAIDPRSGSSLKKAVETVSFRSAAEVFMGADSAPSPTSTADPAVQNTAHDDLLPPPAPLIPPIFIALVVAVVVLVGGAYAFLASSASSQLSNLQTKWAQTDKKSPQQLNAFIDSCNKLLFSEGGFYLDVAQVKALRSQAETAKNVLEQGQNQPDKDPKKDPKKDSKGDADKKAAQENKVLTRLRDNIQKQLSNLNTLMKQATKDEDLTKVTEALLLFRQEIFKQPKAIHDLAETIKIPLKVESDPANASVFLGEDNKAVGQTPALVYVSAGATTVVRVKAGSFRAKTQEVSGESFETIKFKLERDQLAVHKLSRGTIPFSHLSRKSLDTNPHITSQPVANSKKNALFFTSREGLVRALSLTGNQLWQKPALVSPFGSQSLRPLPTARAVFCAGSGVFERDVSGKTLFATLCAIDPNQGIKLWRVDTGSACTTPPSVLKGYQMKNEELVDVLAVGTLDSRVLFLDMNTGVALKNSRDEEKIFQCHGQPTGQILLLGAQAVFCTREDRIYCVDWTVDKPERKSFLELDSDPTAGPVVCQDRILVGTKTGSVYAFMRDPESGTLTQVWKTESTDLPVLDPIVFNDERVYFSDRVNLSNISIKDGKGSSDWQPGFEVDISAPALDEVNQTVYVACNDGVVRAVNQRTGQRVWDHKCEHEGTQLPFIAAPLVFEDRIVAVNKVGVVFSISR